MNKKFHLVKNLIIIFFMISVLFYTDADNLKNTNLESNLTKATVSKHVDGDTIHVEIQGKDYKVRLIGINAPEITVKPEKYGLEASNYLKNRLPIGTEVFLEKDVSETDKYGRLLRYVWVNNIFVASKSNIDSNMINAGLIAKGYARAAKYPPDVKYKDYFSNLEKDAKENKIGLWKTE